MHLIMPCIWNEIMMHNSVDWLMTCKTFATYCAYCKTMDQTLMKSLPFDSLFKLHDQVVIYDEESKTSPTSSEVPRQDD